MGVQKLQKGQILHTQNESVQSLDIILNGAVSASDGISAIRLTAGSVVGLFEFPGQEYIYEYQVLEDTSIYSYEFFDSDDIYKMFVANPKIASTVCSKAIKNANDYYKAYLSTKQAAVDVFEKLKNDQADYPRLCKLLDMEEKAFPELDDLEAPSEDDEIPEYNIAFLDAMIANDESLSKNMYSLGPDIASGVTLTGVSFVTSVLDLTENYRQYIFDLNETTKNFNSEFALVSEKTHQMRQEKGIGSDSVPEIKDSLKKILFYAEEDAEFTSAFTKQLREYSSLKDRLSSNDAIRLLRRNITAGFYRVYKDAFFKSVRSEDQIPIEVKMFFMFGYMDEELASEEKTKKLYQLARDYEADHEECILTMYEWLLKVYKNEVQPSRNEFDLDYPAYLRSEKNNGNITAEEEKQLRDDADHKVCFELDNMCASANRMTFARVTTFSPVFDQLNATRPLERAYLTSDILKIELNRIRKLDFSIFYRERDFNDEKLQIAHFGVQKEILPYIILMPNMGGRMALWQEIEGKDRGTPGRFVMPIFMTEDISKSFTTVCGEYRWEMCKAVQGLRWSDITEPSLTSEYNDYIQCYRKNRSLTADNREKIKKTLKRMGNNMRRTFAEDYLTYISSESKGAPVMNKVARSILFRYCPFEKNLRNTLGTNPQYQELLAIYNKHNKQELTQVMMVIRKLETKQKVIPEDILEQKEFLLR